MKLVVSEGLSFRAHLSLNHKEDLATYILCFFYVISHSKQ